MYIHVLYVDFVEKPFHVYQIRLNFLNKLNGRPSAEG